MRKAALILLAALALMAACRAPAASPTPIATPTPTERSSAMPTLYPIGGSPSPSLEVPPPL
jgi:hypothetical protein